jgi:uncharacterized protein YdaU (DUF1376 family)
MSTPWIRFYWSNWIADTAFLGHCEKGIYMSLLEVYYQHGKPLPFDLDKIYRMIRAMSPEEQKATRYILEEYFVQGTEQQDGDIIKVWRHNRCDRELSHTAERLKITSERGRDAANVRWRKNAAGNATSIAPSNTASNTSSNAPSNAPCNAEPEPEPEPEPEIHPSPQYDPGSFISHPPEKSVCTAPAAFREPKKSVRSAKKTPLREDFAISDRVRKWAEKHAYADLDAHLDAFKRKARMHGYAYADWDAAFMEAVCGDWAKLRGTNRAPPGQGKTARQMVEELNLPQMPDDHRRN